MEFLGIEDKVAAVMARQVFYEQLSQAVHAASLRGKKYRAFGMYGKPEERWFVGTYKQYIKLRHKRSGYNHCKVCDTRIMGEGHCSRCSELLEFPYADQKMRWLKLKEGK